MGYTCHAAGGFDGSSFGRVGNFFFTLKKKIMSARQSCFYFPTAIVVGLFISYLLTFLCHQKISMFDNDLRPDQKIVYDQIVRRRLWYFIAGIVIGLFLSFLYLILFFRVAGLYHGMINFLLILLLTPMIVYSLLPKPVYILETRNITPAETRAWFNIYVCMKNAMMYGFFIGLIATLVIMGTVQVLIRST